MSLLVYLNLFPAKNWTFWFYLFWFGFIFVFKFGVKGRQWAINIGLQKKITKKVVLFCFLNLIGSTSFSFQCFVCVWSMILQLKWVSDGMLHQLWWCVDWEQQSTPERVPTALFSQLIYLLQTCSSLGKT